MALLSESHENENVGLSGYFSCPRRDHQTGQWGGKIGKGEGEGNRRLRNRIGRERDGL